MRARTLHLVTIRQARTIAIPSAAAYLRAAAGTAVDLCARQAGTLVAPSVLAAALLCLGPTGCRSYRALPDAALTETNGATLAQRDVEAIADDYLSALLEYHPELGTMYSLPGARHDRLADNSPEARAAWQAREDAWLKELSVRGMPVEVGSRDWVTYGILYEALASSAAIRICHKELWAASSMTAWHRAVPGLFEIQPVDTPGLQRQALQRLAALPRCIDIEIANLRRSLESGYSAPRLTVEPAVNDVRALAGADSPLLSPGVRAGDPEFAAEVQALFDADVAPAVERFARFLEAEYLPRASEEIGLGFNPDGGARRATGRGQRHSHPRLDAATGR